MNNEIDNQFFSTFRELVSNLIFCGLCIISPATYCLANDYIDKESISLCAMIPTNAISDVFENMSTKASEDISYLLLTSASEENYSWGATG